MMKGMRGNDQDGVQFSAVLSDQFLPVWLVGWRRQSGIDKHLCSLKRHCLRWFAESDNARCGLHLEQLADVIACYGPYSNEGYMEGYSFFVSTNIFDSVFENPKWFIVY